MVIRIKNLRVSTILGVYEKERLAERDVVVNARIEYDAQRAQATDSLDDALDYTQLRDRIVNVVEGTRFRLIETLANSIVQELTEDARILKLRVEVDKPNALRHADSVSAIIDWERRG
jgi:D-erythro-7,8-dihydroneopterin triphosphate epimerase